MKAREYQAELARQVQEKNLKKQREKDEQDRLDRKLLAETAQHNPFGRGGAGAPLKDRDGNIIANLSQAKSAANTGYDMGGGGGSPRANSQPPFAAAAAAHHPSYMFEPALRRGSAEGFGLGAMDFGPDPTTSRKNRANSDEPSFARGGNGIFGEGKVTKHIIWRISRKTLTKPIRLSEKNLIQNIFLALANIFYQYKVIKPS